MTFQMSQVGVYIVIAAAIGVWILALNNVVLDHAPLIRLRYLVAFGLLVGLCTSGLVFLVVLSLPTPAALALALLIAVSGVFLLGRTTGQP